METFLGIMWFGLPLFLLQQLLAPGRQPFGQLPDEGSVLALHLSLIHI